MDCRLCQGTGKVGLHRCPRGVSKHRIMSWLFSHYAEYKRWGRYPDGRGRTYQQLRLLRAFEIIGACVAHFEKPKEGNSGRDPHNSKNG